MERCKSCPGKHQCVPPNGRIDAEIYALGEAPGHDEDRQGVPFCGKTGQELNDGYLPLAGLRRSNIRVANTISCLPDTSKNRVELKKPAHRELAVTCFEQHAEQDLLAYPRELIVGMGAFANHVLSRYDTPIDLEMQHGIPQKTMYGWVFPMFHPAMGLHEPKKMLNIRTDWARLKKYLKGSLRIAVDPYEGGEEYYECETPSQLDAYLASVGSTSVALATDTEITRKKAPYCCSVSVVAGTGVVIRAENRAVLHQFQWWLDQWRGPLLFHNWLFDGEVVEEMGLNFNYEQVIDTMVKVFHLGNLPQGLKALAYREMGMHMQDFNDLVHEDSRRLVLDFYQQAFMRDWPVPDADVIQDGNGDYKVHKPQGFRTKLKRMFSSLVKHPDMDVFEMWTKNWVEHHAMVQQEMGEWPGKCISYVPWDKVIRYAARDADTTVRLWDLIQYIMTRVERYPQELWTDGYSA